MPHELQDIETLQEAPDQQSRESAKKSSGDLVPALVIQSHEQLDRVGETCWMTGLAEGRNFSLGRNSPDFCQPGSLIGTPLTREPVPA